MKAVLGKIITPNRCFGRILVDGGHIVVVDNGNDIPEGAQVITLAANEMLLPPLSDCHVHFFQTGIYLAALNLGNMGAKSELLSQLRWMPLDRYRIGETIWAWNYNPENQMPNAEEMQSVVPDVPVFIRRADGHCCSLSDAAQKMLPKTIRNETGIYRGQPHENVVRYFFTHVPNDVLRDAAKRVSIKAAEIGALSIHALVPSFEWAQILNDIRETLPVKVEIFVESTDIERAGALGMKLIGGCLLLDGSFGSHTAAISQPYADRPESRGMLYYSDDELLEFFSAARRNKIAVAMHAIGDRAIEQYLKIAECVAEAQKLYRWRIEHAELVTPAQIEKIAELGITLSVQPAFEVNWGGENGLYARRLGERWRSTNCYRTAMQSGILLLGGSDSYVTPIDPIAGIHAAMHHPNAEQRLDFDSAMALFSTNPARWAGVESTGFTIGAQAKGVLIDGGFDDDKPPKCRLWEVK